MSLLSVIFLGLCALIIVAQVIPSFLLFVGMVKALFLKPTEETIEKLTR